jgi:hypothetical protein
MGKIKPKISQRAIFPVLSLRLTIGKLGISLEERGMLYATQASRNH